jgi:hypothetical protein
MLLLDQQLIELERRLDKIQLQATPHRESISF